MRENAIIRINKYKLCKFSAFFLANTVYYSRNCSECNFLKLAEITARNCELNQEGMQFKCRYNAAANCVIVSNAFGAFS